MDFMELPRLFELGEQISGPRTERQVTHQSDPAKQYADASANSRLLDQSSFQNSHEEMKE